MMPPGARTRRSGAFYDLRAAHIAIQICTASLGARTHVADDEHHRAEKIVRIALTVICFTPLRRIKWDASHFRCVFHEVIREPGHDLSMLQCISRLSCRRPIMNYTSLGLSRFMR